MLEEETGRGGTLETVRSVVTTRRQDEQPEVPTIWIFRGTSENQHPPRTLTRTWKMPVFLVAVVEDDDPERGQDRAEELAERAIEVVLRDRNLGHPSFIRDTIDLRLQPDEPGRGGRTAAAAGVVEVTMIIPSPLPK